MNFQKVTIRSKKITNKRFLLILSLLVLILTVFSFILYFNNENIIFFKTNVDLNYQTKVESCIINQNLSITVKDSLICMDNFNNTIYSPVSAITAQNLWTTNQGWFIACIVVTTVATIAYITCIFLNYSSNGTVWEDFSEYINYWLTIWVSVSIIGFIISGCLISSEKNYGPIILVASAVGVYIFSSLFFHLIIFICIVIYEKIKYGEYGIKYDELNDIFYNDDNVDSWENEIKTWNKDRLITYCKSKEMVTNPKRFIYFTKKQIIDWIQFYHSGKDLEMGMNLHLRFFNKNQLMENCNKINGYSDKDMNELQIACEIAGYEYNFKNSLRFFTKNELEFMCKHNKIPNYSNLNYFDLINLISSYENLDFHYSTDTLDLPWFNEPENIQEPVEKKWKSIESKKVTTNSTNNFTDKHNKEKEENQNFSQQKNISNTTFKDIAGLESVKKIFEEKIILPIQYADLYKKFKKTTGGGILLFGLPGTGKTMFAKAVANEIDAKYFSIKCSDIKSKWFGESELRIKELFEKARKSKRAIIFIDEFESIGRKRTDENDLNIVPEILSQMQGVGTDNSNILVIAATNRPWNIDSALLRPGRFDEKIYVPLPDFLARKEIFKIKLKDVPIENLDFDYLSKITENCNGADIEYFCERLKMSAIDRCIKTNKKQKINDKDLKEAKKGFRSSVNQKDLKEMEKFINSF